KVKIGAAGTVRFRTIPVEQDDTDELPDRRTYSTLQVLQRSNANGGDAGAGVPWPYSGRPDIPTITDMNQTLGPRCLYSNSQHSGLSNTAPLYIHSLILAYVHTIAHSLTPFHYIGQANILLLPTPFVYLAYSSAAPESNMFSEPHATALGQTQVLSLRPLQQETITMSDGKTNKALGRSVADGFSTDEIQHQVETIARRNETLKEIVAARARNEVIEIDEGYENGSGGAQMNAHSCDGNLIIEIGAVNEAGTGEVPLGMATGATNETVVGRDNRGETGEVQMRVGEGVASQGRRRRRRRRYARGFWPLEAEPRTPRMPLSNWEDYDLLRESFFNGNHGRH
ncbi:hypothetical protein V492_03771, partial [Pseudogymnoascus sp. VKM F-4246]